MKNFYLLFVCALVFASCGKDLPVKDRHIERDISIPEARADFLSRISTLAKHGQRFERMGMPDWDRYFTRKVNGINVLIVPVAFKQPLFIKRVHDSVTIALEHLTRLFIYRDENGRLVYEVVTTIPDDACIMQPSGSFTGMVFIEGWDGSAIRSYRYLSDGHIRSFVRGPEQRKDLLSEHTQWCFVDFYYCASSMGFISCSYSFSQAYACGIDGGDDGAGGLPPEYYPVYGSGAGVNGKPPLPTDSVVGIGRNTVLLTMPDEPVYDVIDYLRCFHRTDNGSYSYRVVLNVDQPKTGSRAIIADNLGNTIFGSIEVGSATVGHTWFTFIETHKTSGLSLIRSVGFFPRKSVDPYLNSSSRGIVSNDGGRNVDVRLIFDVTATGFFKLLNNCSAANNEYYDIYNNNCTGWSLNKLRNAWQISLPETMDQFFIGTDKGPTPGNLGEDLRFFDLSSIRNSPDVQHVSKAIQPGKSLLNSGNCPKLPPQ